MKKEQDVREKSTASKGDGHPEDPTVPNRAHTEMKAGKNSGATAVKTKSCEK